MMCKGASCNTWTSQDKGTLRERCDATTPFLVNPTPLSPWDLEPDFRPCYKLAEMTLLLLASSLKKLLHIISAKCNVVYKCIVLEVQNIHRSFVGWTSNRAQHYPPLPSSSHGASASAPRRLRRKPTAAPTAFQEKAPEATRRCTLRRPSARSQLRSCCSPKAPRWTPRGTMARASNPGSRHLRRLFRDWNFCIFTKCLAKLWVFHTKKCETCREQWSQCNMPIVLIVCGKWINVVEKMPWNLFDVFVNVFCFKSKIFIVRLSVERV